MCAAAAAKSLQLCPTLCNPIDGGPPGSPVPGVLEARTLEWVAISFSNAWKWKVKSLSRAQLFTTPWIAAHQAPPSMEFSRQEYWSGLPLQLCLTFCDPMDCILSRSKHKSSCDVVVTVLFFSRYCTIRLKTFSLFFVFVFLWTICVKSIIHLLQYSII